VALSRLLWAIPGFVAALCVVVGIIFLAAGAIGGLLWFVPGVALFAWALSTRVRSWFSGEGTKRILFGGFCMFLGVVIVAAGISGGLIWALLGIPFLAWGLWAKAKAGGSQAEGYFLPQQPILWKEQPAQPWATGPVQSPPSQPTADHRYCSQCGVQNTAGSAHCRICGADL